MTDKPVACAPLAPHPHVVAKLEEWLSAAKRGEIDGIALAAETTDGAARYGYAGRYGTRLVGGLEMAKHWVMHNLQNGDEL